MDLLELVEEMDRRGFRATRFDGYEMRYASSDSVGDLIPAMQRHRIALVVIYAGRANLSPASIVLAVGHRLGFPAYPGLAGAGEEDWRVFAQLAGVGQLVDAIDHALGWLPRTDAAVALAAAGRAA